MSRTGLRGTSPLKISTWIQVAPSTMWKPLRNKDWRREHILLPGLGYTEYIDSGVDNIHLLSTSH